jgi:signal transduction histidine kinase
MLHLPARALGWLSGTDGSRQGQDSMRHQLVNLRQPLRDYTSRQIFVIQFAYAAAVLLIYCAQLIQPTVTVRLLHLWLLESVLNLALRSVLYVALRRRLQRAPDPQLPWLLIPSFTALVAGLHWGWTATLFLQPLWDSTTVITLVVFVLITVAQMTIAPASAIAAMIHGVCTWLPTVVVMWPSDPAGTANFLVLLLALASILAFSAYMTFVQLGGLVKKGDEADALLAELERGNRELARLQHAAASELRARTQFFNHASHDFRQRLHAMKMEACAAQRVVHGSPAAASLDMLARATDNLDAYVNEVLEFARMEAVKVQPSNAVVQLQNVLQRLLVHFEAVAEGREVELRIRPTSAVLYTDERLLQRLLENLVANAIKFTRGGVVVAARRRGASYSIEVWDQGPGIPPQARDSIFTAFYQAKVYEDSERVGFGLGLAIVKRLAERLECEIALESRLGRGTVFKVVVPAHPACEPAPRALQLDDSEEPQEEVGSRESGLGRVRAGAK